MNSSLAVGIILGLIGSAFSTVAQVALWQRKEYRWDRLRSHLGSPDGRRLLKLHLWLALAVAIAWFLDSELVSLAVLIAVIFYQAARVYKRGVARPKFTIKALTILAGVGLVVIPLFMVTALQAAAIILILPLLIAGIVQLVNIPFNLKKKQIIQAAARKRQHYMQLKVIGITGSYGKTSTKYFLQQLLTYTGHYSLATAEHRNEALVVAQDILANLADAHEFYVVEMGAYRQGEIAAVAKLVQPHVGILTVIGNQHLDLFGSPEAITAAKWELINALPASGVAVLNADDSRQVKQAENFAGKIVWYSLTKKANVYADDIDLQPRASRLVLHLGSEQAKVALPLISLAAIHSAVAAAAGAYAAGVPAGKIFAALATLKPYTRTMELVTGRGGATIIDDSYSANEAGVIEAIQHLARFPEMDKRIIMVPLIELGPEAPAVHRHIGEALKKVVGLKTYVYGTAYEQELRAGGVQITSLTQPKQLLQLIQKDVTSETVILLEGRIPAMVRQALLS